MAQEHHNDAPQRTEDHLQSQPARSPDEMDRLMQEAREANLLHGKLGRLLLGNYEGHKEQVWLQRGATAMIVALVIGVIAVVLGAPQFVSLGLFGIGFLVAIACIIMGILHAFRWVGYAAEYIPVDGDEQKDAEHASEHRRSSDAEGDDNGRV